MPIFFGNNAAFTPSTQNWTLDAGTTVVGQMARILEVSWGGELTTTTAMRTRWCRPTTNGSTTFLAIGLVQSGSANTGAFGTSLTRFGTFTTVPTQPTAPAGLYATSWNAHGGIGRWLAAPGEEWWIMYPGITTSKNQILCVQDTGLTASSMSAGVAWEEM